MAFQGKNHNFCVCKSYHSTTPGVLCLHHCLLKSALRPLYLSWSAVMRPGLHWSCAQKRLLVERTGTRVYWASCPVSYQQHQPHRNVWIYIVFVICVLSNLDFVLFSPYFSSLLSSDQRHLFDMYWNIYIRIVADQYTVSIPWFSLLSRK